MRKRFGYMVLLSCAGMVLLLGAVGRTDLAGQSSEAPDGANKPAEEAFHNIQVFRGMPQSELLPVMHYMRASLGVHCDYCHIAENGMYWKDEKQAKITARRMINMVFDINNKNFGGQPVVTCNTCHRGHARPDGIPSVNQAAFENTTRSPAEPPSSLPTIEAILENYEKAMGGEAALSAVRSRFIKLTTARPRLVDPQQIPLHVEIYEKLPDKVLVVTTAGPQSVRVGSNGPTAWIEAAGKTRPATIAEQSRLQSFLTVYPLGSIKIHYQKLRVVGKEEIENGVSAYVVEGIANHNNKRERLYFDSQSGLLIRRIEYTRTRIGDDPEQADFDDYRDMGGVKVPFRVKTSALDNNHLNTVRLISTVENNVAMDDHMFTRVQASQ